MKKITTLQWVLIIGSIIICSFITYYSFYGSIDILLRSNDTVGVIWVMPIFILVMILITNDDKPTFIKDNSITAQRRRKVKHLSRTIKWKKWKNILFLNKQILKR